MEHVYTESRPVLCYTLGLNILYVSVRTRGRVSSDAFNGDDQLF